MKRYIALLRGINVGGNNIIKMKDLKLSLESMGLNNVITYINSGNILFTSEIANLENITNLCEMVILQDFGIDIPVFVITIEDFTKALSCAPDWWNQSAEAKHDAFFVIPPITASQIIEKVGTIKEEYEKVDYYDRIIFWSAPLATYSRTRYSKIVKDKTMYRAITVRGANTTLKLLALAKEQSL